MKMTLSNTAKVEAVCAIRRRENGGIIKSVVAMKQNLFKDMQCVGRNLLVTVLALVMVVDFAVPAKAATITESGVLMDNGQNTSGSPNLYGAWRSTNVTKPAGTDADGDNVIGDDGYSVFVQGSTTPMTSQPSFISSINSYSTASNPD